VLLFLPFVFNITSIDPDCTATGTPDKGEFDFYDSGKADYVLYIIICETGSCYLNDMQNGGLKLLDVIQNEYKTTGSTLELTTLYSDGLKDWSGNFYSPDWSKYTQVWVADLSSSTDVASPMMDIYAKVGTWYNSRGQPHIICDGRYISSLWPAAAANSYYTNIPRPERTFILNYFANLRVRGGGLALLTDHNVFNYGINEINRLIGINDFYGYFYLEPYLMEIDIGSSIFQYPKKSYYNISTIGDYRPTIPTYWPTRTALDLGIFIDDSSTAFTPFNNQPNGKFLYQIGWHRGHLDEPGIATTIRGQVGFLIEIVTPVCNQRFQNDDTISFIVRVVKGGSGSITYTWTSSLSGAFLSNAVDAAANITKKASDFVLGTHVITVLAVDSSKLQAQAKVRISIVYLTGNEKCFAAAWNHGSDVYELFPIKRNKTAVDYFSYGVPVPDSSNLGDKFEEARTGQYFFYQEPNGDVRVISVFGSGVDKSVPGRAYADLIVTNQGNASYEQIAPALQFSSFPYNAVSGIGSATYTFGATSSGFVFGPLSTTLDFCVNLYFDRSKEDNLDVLKLRSHARPSNETSSTQPIVFFANAPLLTTSLQLCYGQCHCADKQLASLTDKFSNRAVKFGLNGVIGNYSQGVTCTWNIIPNTPDTVWGISLYFDAFDFGTGDQLQVFEGSTQNTIYTGRTIPPNLLSNFGTLKAIFSSDNDNSTGLGFYVEYWVLPQLNQIVPDHVPSEQMTPIVVHGANFIDSPNLMCLFDGVPTPAKYIDVHTIGCVAPMHAIGTYRFEVSNDGKRYTLTDGTKFPNVNITWYDATCDNITDCALCAKKNSCEWCNILANPGASFCQPLKGVKQCLPPNVLDNTQCCSQCQNFNSCSGGGKCNCNNTCTCDANHYSIPPDCSCVKCPVNLITGNVCSFDVIGQKLGLACQCNGSCNCPKGFWGKDCSCIICDGTNGVQCGGHGTCQCDGNCTCNPGYISTTVLRKKCDCSTICPKNCSGHGNCSCGSCICDPGSALLQDCSCKEKCDKDCNGNGNCACDGSCQCFQGFNGTLCDVKLDCNLSCDACQAQSYCGWCPKDVNLTTNVTGKCYHKSDKLDSSNCLASDLLRGGSCATFVVQNVPPVNPIGTYIAIAAGFAVLAALAAILAFALKKSETKSDILLNGQDPFGGAQGVQSPLYQADKTVGQNVLFQSKTDAEL